MSENIIQLNEAAIKGELKDLVRNSVEETLNALLDYETDELINADRYERTGDRQVSWPWRNNISLDNRRLLTIIPIRAGAAFRSPA
jgi:hypothetical protein